MEGKHLEKKSGGGKIWLVIAGLTVLLAAAYLGLCAWVGGQGIFPNVTIAGRDVSGMYEDQAAQVAVRALEDAQEKASVTLNYGDWSGTIRADQLQPFEAYHSNAALAAMRVGRESFLKQGFQYLRHLMGEGVDVWSSPLCTPCWTKRRKRWAATGSPRHGPWRARNW